MNSGTTGERKDFLRPSDGPRPRWTASSRYVGQSTGARNYRYVHWIFLKYLVDDCIDNGLVSPRNLRVLRTLGATGVLYKTCVNIVRWSYESRFRSRMWNLLPRTFEAVWCSQIPRRLLWSRSLWISGVLAVSDNGHWQMSNVNATSYKYETRNDHITA